MEVIEIRKEVVEIDLEEEVEMEIAHFVKPLEKELEQLGFTVHVDEDDKCAFYTMHYKQLSVGIHLTLEENGEYFYNLYAHIYGSVNDNFEELCAFERGTLLNARKVIKRYLEM